MLQETINKKIITNFIIFYFIKKRKIVFQYLDVNFWFLNSEYRTRIFGRHLPLIDVLFFL